MQDPTEFDDRNARPTPSSGLTFVGLLSGVVLAATLLGQLAGSDSSQPSSPAAAHPAVAPTKSPDLTTTPSQSVTREPDRPIGVKSIMRCPVRLGGFALRTQPQIPVWALERWDCNARSEPWSVVIRASDGRFGVNSAVVTFPVPAKGSEAPLASTTNQAAKPPGARWNPAARMLIWPVGNGYARIVGDLGQAKLAELAISIDIKGGKPHVMQRDGFATVTATTFDSPVVHEMRYGTADLGVENRLGEGFVYTGVRSGASFESRAFEDRARSAGFVRGKPAIYSEVPGGHGTLAWESAPGEVAYLRYKGSATRADAIAVMRALADRGRPLSYAQWQTKDRIPVGEKSPQMERSPG